VRCSPARVPSGYGTIAGWPQQAATSSAEGAESGVVGTGLEPGSTQLLLHWLLPVFTEDLRGGRLGKGCGRHRRTEGS